MPHVFFAVILVGSLIANQQAKDMLPQVDDNKATVIRIARANGLALRNEQPIAGGALKTLVFDAPGCTQPVSVALLSITFEEMPIVQAVPGQHDNRRYVYLNRIWNRPERLPVFVEWQMHRALTMFGLTRYVPSRYMLLVDSPPGCRVADAIDWQNVWDRNFLSTTTRADITSLRN